MGSVLLLGIALLVTGCAGNPRSCEGLVPHSSIGWVGWAGIFKLSVSYSMPPAGHRLFSIRVFSITGTQSPADAGAIDATAG